LPTQPATTFLLTYVTFPFERDIVRVNAGSTYIQTLQAGAAWNKSDITPNEQVTFPAQTDIVIVSRRSTTFHELYQRYSADVYRFAHWLTGNPEDARDITSETFARVWAASEEPRMDSVKAYLFAIARNLHRKQWRRSSRHEALDDAMPDPAARPDEVAGNHDEFRRSLAAVQALPENDRAILLLRAEDEMSYEDIAAVTGLSVATAKVRVFRARAKLTVLLQKLPREQ
jgi:RNA polymerase sigma-70 factor, ECF subfamily